SSSSSSSLPVIILSDTLYEVGLINNDRLKDNESAMLEACRLDLGRSEFETYLSEICWCENDILFMCNNLE
ncbi:hypothetical protein LTR28_000300, partial [Elasticomyces elasticus]